MVAKQMIFVRVQLPNGRQIDRLCDIGVMGATAKQLLQTLKAEYASELGGNGDGARLYGFSVMTGAIDEHPVLAKYLSVRPCLNREGDLDYNFAAASFEETHRLCHDTKLHPIYVLQQHAKEVQPLVFKVPPPATRGSPADRIQVIVKTLTGAEFAMDTHTRATINEIRTAIEMEVGVPLDQQRLMFGRKQLWDGDTLADYHIQDGAKLSLWLRLRGGMFHQTSGREDMDLSATERTVHVQLEDGFEVTLQVQAGHTMRDLKTLLHQELGQQGHSAHLAVAAAGGGCA